MLSKEGNLEGMSATNNATLEENKVEIGEVSKVMESLDTRKSPGPD